MSAHSLGPWKVSDDRVEDVHGNCVCVRPGVVYDEEWEPDAILIEAAPELLALARRQQEWISRALAAFEGEPDPSENEGKNIDAAACALIARIEAGT